MRILTSNKSLKNHKIINYNTLKTFCIVYRAKVFILNKVFVKGVAELRWRSCWPCFLFRPELQRSGREEATVHGPNSSYVTTVASSSCRHLCRKPVLCRNISIINVNVAWHLGHFNKFHALLYHKYYFIFHIFPGHRFPPHVHAPFNKNLRFFLRGQIDKFNASTTYSRLRRIHCRDLFKSSSAVSTRLFHFV